MIKAKSTKLRDLITLRILFKETDKDHFINSTGLNERLKPYDLECDRRVLQNNVKALREFGFDIKSQGGGKNSGIWIGKRPLESLKLDKVIFAVSTNPYLSKEQSNEILNCLKPLVTVYDEEKLVSIIDTNPDLQADDTLYGVYSTISKAIINRRRVRYFTNHMKYRKETQSLASRISKEVLFTPKWIYHAKGELYMVGYNNTVEEPRAVALKSIVDIKIAPKMQKEVTEASLKILDNTIPEEYIPEDKEIVIYKGPVDFFCKNRHIEELYNRFGPPCKPIAVNSRHKATYSVSEAVVTTKTLFWMSGINGHEIRLKGPVKLIKSVRDYYAYLSSTLTKAVIVSNL